MRTGYLWALALAVAYGAAAVAPWACAGPINTAGQRDVHDPSRILKLDGTYYLYYTGNSTTRIRSRTSTDLVNWSSGAGLFTTAPAWTTTQVPGSSNFWAPDVVYANGEYRMYYSVSTFGSQRSAIGLATSPTLNPSAPNYNWTDRGPVLTSIPTSPYNAIDPAILQNDDGRTWMTFGSFWNGIYITELDPTTGMRITPNSSTTRLAQNVPSTAIEAAYLHKHEDTYYLFVNYGTCCQGVNSTYNIRVGRGNSPTGPFVDKNGVNMVSGGGTLFLGTEGTAIGPGHLSIFEENDQEIFTYHYYDGADNGRSKLNWRTLAWTPDGWPILKDTLLESDFNTDGHVNGDDLLAWTSAFGATGADADGDHDSDGSDYLAWQRQFGAAAVATASAVPEPTAMLFLPVAVLIAASRRRLRRPLAQQ